MIELSNERVEQILHEETRKTEELPTILRGIYTRYMHQYEEYFADLDALNDDKIAELKQYLEETKSLVRYYYMDIPLDVCEKISEFDEKYNTKLLGPHWHVYLADSYEEFRDKIENEGKNEKCLKAEFAEQNLKDFYDTMDYVFRDGFGTGSKTAEEVYSGLQGVLFGA